MGCGVCNGFIVSFDAPYSHQRQKHMHLFNSSNTISSALSYEKIFDSLLFSAICKCCRVMLMVFFSFVLSRWIGSIVLSFRLMPHVPLDIETYAFIHSTAAALSAHQRQKPMHSFNSGNTVCSSLPYERRSDCSALPCHMEMLSSNAIFLIHFF